MDDVDLANDHIEQEMALRLKHRAPAEHPKPTGSCHNCFTETFGAQIFCDAECAEEFEWVTKRRNR